MLILGCLGDPAPQRERPWHMGSEWSSGWYHNSAAALLDGGRVVAAVEEERLTRRKHSGKFPFRAIAYCLAEGGLSLDDVDRIAFGEEGGEGEHRDPRISARRIADVLRSQIPAATDLLPKIRLVEHHVGHAMSAFVPSGFDRALVFTCDGFGDGISGLLALGCDGRLVQTLDTFSFANSIGRFYSSALGFLGYGSGDEYKMMGLAAYGDPSFYRELFRTFYALQPEGRFTIAFHEQREMSARLARVASRREPDGPFLPEHQHIAAAIQEAFERIVFHVLAHWRRQAGETRLCLAGGTAQNSTFNGKLLASGLFDEVWVQPAAHDAGIALGAALQIEATEAPRCGARGPAGVYFGPTIGERSEVARSVARWSEFVDATPQAGICDAGAELLASGQIIGWVQGRSEFGPRALGNRSILADPRPASNRDRVNAVVKMREWYRPFAPAVRADRASRYFAIPEGASMPFMTFTVPVREEMRPLLGAVTHVDGSARVQTVARADNALFFDLLTAFERRTGLPVLLNTSFNNDAEPIVQDVDDAIACFLTTALDALIVGTLRIARRAVEPASWLRLVPRLRSDAMLATIPASETDAPPLHAVVARNWRIHPISRALFEILSVCDGAPAFEAAEKTGADPACAGRELFELWTRRVVLLRPSE